MSMKFKMKEGRRGKRKGGKREAGRKGPKKTDSPEGVMRIKEDAYPTKCLGTLWCVREKNNASSWEQCPQKPARHLLEATSGKNGKNKNKNTHSI